LKEKPKFPKNQEANKKSANVDAFEIKKSKTTRL